MKKSEKTEEMIENQKTDGKAVKENTKTVNKEKSAEAEKNNSSDEEKNEKSTELETVNKEAKKPAKTKKAPKMLPRKKLPKLFKKAYTAEKFEKKIMKKLYIETDKEYVKSLFKDGKDKKGLPVVVVPQDFTITKKDLNRCKTLAKDINNQKFCIKLVPLCAVVILCAAIGIVVSLFKNTFVKWAVTSSMEGIFSAECDVGDVDFQIFGSKLEVKNIQQTNKDKPETNLFEIGDIDLDFNLTELLKGKFVVERMAVTGVAIDSQRQKEGKVYSDSSETKEEKATVSEKMNGLLTSASDELKALFGDYNPETMLKNFESELKSPDTAKQIAEEVQQKVQKWSQKPDEMKNEITDFSTSVDALIKKLQSASAAQIPEYIKEGQELLKKGQELQTSFKTVADDIKTDSKAVKTYSDKVQTAVKSDTALVKTKVNDLKNTFSKEGLQKIMDKAVQSLVYKYCGEYSPYVNQLVDYAKDSLKNSSSSSSEKKTEEKSTPAKRMDGRDVYFKKDPVPKLLIQKLEASGKEYQEKTDLFNGTATDISSNMDQWGKPAVIQADFKVGSHDNHGNVTIDARTTSSAPLVSASYNGKGYPVNFDAQIFKLESASDIDAKMTAASDGSWSIGGTLNMGVSGMTGMDFQPEQICKIYKNALSKISKLTVGFTVDYSKSSGITVKLDDKIAAQLAEPVIKAVEEEMTSIANNAMNQLTDLIASKTGIATDEIAKYTKLEGDVSTYQDQLKNKMNELQKQVTEYGKSQATNAVKDAASKVLGDDAAANKISNKASSLLKGLGF